MTIKTLGTFFIAFAFLLTGSINAQSFDIGMLDNATSLLDKGDHAESGKALGTAMGLLTKSSSAIGGDFATKIASQAGSLTKLLPGLKTGTANIASIKGIIETIKMLYGAMQLNKMVKSGSLLGKSASLLSNVELLKGGLSQLPGGKSVDKITKSMDKIAKKAPKLEKTGFFAKMANKGVTKKLESSLGMLNGII